MSKKIRAITLLIEVLLMVAMAFVIVTDATNIYKTMVIIAVMGVDLLVFIWNEMYR